MASQVKLLPAKCALDIGDGSERGEYVSQQYILNVLGRPHRAVNIMYTYYTHDKYWPARISEACADMDVSSAWGYPYDDYYPFCEGGKQFEQMRDIRRHGQDVMLTITTDCSLTDDEIRDFVRQLIPFGRMMLRINHECNGSWFTHNKRFSYEEVAAFFVRFAAIVRKEAPNIRTVFCAGLAGETDEEFIEKKDIIDNFEREFASKGDPEKVEKEDVFAAAYAAADIWSADKYTALHYGWPYDTAEPGILTYDINPPERLFERYKRTYDRLEKLFGPKPLIQAEFNADGDVTGPLSQGEMIARYYNAVSGNEASYIKGISMYQFRDRGRLGLEIEDPSDPSTGIRQPVLDEYLKILSDPYFLPRFESGPEVSYPATLRWGGSEDADGLQIPVKLEKTPSFCEVMLPKQLSLMIEFNGRWFYKAAGVECVDLMGAFFDRPLEGAANIPLRIFATPPDGENHDDGNENWRCDQYYVINSEPQMRIRYETPLSVFVRDSLPQQ